MLTDALPEFRADWMLAGKAETTIDFYVNLLHLLGAEHPLPSLYDVKTWVGVAATIPIRRKRAQAVRAYGRWSESIGDNDFPWWRNLPLPTEAEKPQPTATEAESVAAFPQAYPS